ncbi:anthranilate synthase component I family protein [Allomuricauda sp. M10]|uniref:anthranilate synthase component I family protein n=1 Tax=Allomuricauda sp. M10 TaxID=2683292 RepID=UPI001D198127|nr:anthranilate synthase component I family protein [Muricauda sp. M10]
MRTCCSFKVKSIPKAKKALLQWSKAFEKVIWLDSNNHQDPYSSFEACLAIGEAQRLISLDEIESFINRQPDWLFGYFSYDLKNELEDLVSNNVDELKFPLMYFFQPKKVIVLKGAELHFQYLNAYQDEIEEDFVHVSELEDIEEISLLRSNPIKIKMRIHKDAYFEKANRFLGHIHRGDIYEANFCQEFYAEGIQLDPLEIYKKLNAISEPPFATFMRLDDHYLMCASPERFLKKVGRKIISQPIKGTAPRGKNKSEDLKFKTELEHDEKERAENIMIVDLVRNDLSKSALQGSVVVEDLCKVHSYKQVHQMISTVISTVSKKKNPVELIKETFPMGSMTGAPKLSAMQIIENLEETKRGLYSGAVGYFDPNGDFDFNVVIRSILYNVSSRYVSFSVGSAITSKSDPEKEYRECLLKAKAMRKVLEKG